MLFLWNFQKHFFYTTPPGDYFWFVRSLPKNDIKMTTIKAIMVTLILALNLFLSFAITLEAAIESNLRILEIFKRNVFGGVLSYHKTIV